MRPISDKFTEEVNIEPASVFQNVTSNLQEQILRSESAIDEIFYYINQIYKVNEDEMPIQKDEFELRNLPQDIVGALNYQINTLSKTNDKAQFIAHHLKSIVGYSQINQKESQQSSKAVKLTPPFRDITTYMTENERINREEMLKEFHNRS